MNSLSLKRYLAKVSKLQEGEKSSRDDFLITILLSSLDVAYPLLPMMRFNFDILYLFKHSVCLWTALRWNIFKKYKISVC